MKAGLTLIESLACDIKAKLIWDEPCSIDFIPIS